LSLGLGTEEASNLRTAYYTQYGLTLRGLIIHHNIGESSYPIIFIICAHSICKLQIDPLDFDRKCDGSLPLEEMIPPNPRVRKLFQDIDRSKARVWALTNAYYPVSSTLSNDNII
jgi:pyrimidine and pyridine-specific 5'-nucleotidase